MKIGSGGLEFDDFVFTELENFGVGTYTLIDSDSEIQGTLGTALTGNVGSFNGTLGLADGGKDLVLTVVVPEPSSLALLLGGVALLGMHRRRRG